MKSPKYNESIQITQISKYFRALFIGTKVFMHIAKKRKKIHMSHVLPTQDIIVNLI
jgi:hypothetical protein